MLSLHIVFLVLWAGALVYMPRLFLRQAMTEDPQTRREVMLMQRWLYAKIMTPSALLAVAAGTWLVFERGFEGGWLHVKLALVLLMAFFHTYCGKLMVALKQQPGMHRSAYYRVLPAVPALLVAVVVVLVTGKPF